MFLLKARRPEKYRERAVYVYPGQDGRHPVQPTIEFVDRPTEDQDPMGRAAQASGRAADGEPWQPEPLGHLSSNVVPLPTKEPALKRERVA